MKNTLLLAGLAQAALLVPGASASLLVYESFNGYTTGQALGGQAAQGTGLTGNWATRASTTSMQVSATGLTFGSLVTSGGSVTFSNSQSSTPRVSVEGVAIDTAAPFTGTLYASMLFNLSSAGTANDNLAAMRIATNQDITTGVGLGTWAKSQTQSQFRPGTSYDASSTAAGQTLTLNTTYLAISVYTNVGATLSAGTTGTATTYVLDLAQFEDFVSAGRSTANLQARAAGSGAGDVTAIASESISSGLFNFGDGSYLGLASFVASTGGTVAGTFDELRWGSTLDGVTAIPEPSAFAALAGLGALGLVATRRRRVRA